MPRENRQTTRTRAAIQAAFAELVFTKRYGEIRMVDVARTANIGRSTLYLHYPDKDAILLDNMTPLLSDLARAVEGPSAQPAIETTLAHIWSHRDRGRVVLFGTTGQKLENALASRIAENLPGRMRAGPAPFMANPIAAAILAILRTWLKGEASGTIPDIARHICASARAIATAAS